MRSLQRLRHVRPSAQSSTFQQARIHRLDTKAVKNRERAIWIGRLRRLAFLVLLAFGATGAISFVAGTRIVVQGTVRANVALLPSPMDARIADWAVQPGSPVAAGDILGTLEPTAPDTRSRELVAKVEAAEAQLAWFDAGGELENSGLEQRVDRIAAARRSESLELAQRGALERAASVREAEKALADAAVLEAEARLEATVAAGEAQERARVDAVHQADIAADLAERDKEIVRDLGLEGIQSERAVAVAVAESLMATSRASAERSRLDALTIENDGAVALARASLARARATASVAEARLQTARAEIEASAARARAWAREAEHHASLGPAVEVDPITIRTARRAKLLADVEVARQALASHRAAVGTRTIIASSPGSVDEVLKLAGSVVERGEDLIRICDAQHSEIVAYATPSTAARIAVGDLCTVYCPDDGRRAAATVQSIGQVWIPAPEALKLGTGAFVAVTMMIDDGISPFSADSRIKAAFETDRWTAVKARVSDWFER